MSLTHPVQPNDLFSKDSKSHNESSSMVQGADGTLYRCDWLVYKPIEEQISIYIINPDTLEETLYTNFSVNWPSGEVEEGDEYRVENFICDYVKDVLYLDINLRYKGNRLFNVSTGNSMITRGEGIDNFEIINVWNEKLLAQGHHLYNWGETVPYYSFDGSRVLSSYGRLIYNDNNVLTYYDLTKETLQSTVLPELKPWEWSEEKFYSSYNDFTKQEIENAFEPFWYDTSGMQMLYANDRAIFVSANNPTFGMYFYSFENNEWYHHHHESYLDTGGKSVRAVDDNYVYIGCYGENFGDPVKYAGISITDDISQCFLFRTGIEFDDTASGLSHTPGLINQEGIGYLPLLYTQSYGLERYSPYPFTHFIGTALNQETNQPINNLNVSYSPSEVSEVTSHHPSNTQSNTNGIFKFIVPSNLWYDLSFWKECHRPGLGNNEVFYSGLKVVEETYSLTMEPISPEIYTPEELFDIRYCTNLDYQLMNDIDLEGFEIPNYHPDDTWERNNFGSDGNFPPIRDYYNSSSTIDNVTIEGNNYSIKNLKAENSSVNMVGLFQEFGGAVNNLKLENINTKARWYCGGLAGINNGLNATDCHITGNIEQNDEGGAFGGYVSSSGSIIEKCSFRGNITASGGYGSGGIVGWGSQATIKNCFVRGDITDNSKVAGIAADNNHTVENCYFVGTLSESNDKAVISQGSITNCYFDSDVITLTQEEYDALDPEEKPRTTEQMTYEFSPDTFVDWNFGNKPEDMPADYNDGYPELIGTVDGIWWVSYKFFLRSLTETRSVLWPYPYNVFVKHNGTWIPADVFGKDGEWKGAKTYVKTSGVWQLIQE